MVFVFMELILRPMFDKFSRDNRIHFWPGLCVAGDCDVVHVRESVNSIWSLM